LDWNTAASVDVARRRAEARAESERCMLEGEFRRMIKRVILTSGSELSV